MADRPSHGFQDQTAGRRPGIDDTAGPLAQPAGATQLRYHVLGGITSLPGRFDHLIQTYPERFTGCARQP